MSVYMHLVLGASLAMEKEICSHLCQTLLMLIWQILFHQQQMPWRFEVSLLQEFLCMDTIHRSFLICKFP